MKYAVTGTTNYVLLNGISVPSNIKLSDNVELQAADTSHLDLKTALMTCSHPDDIAVVAAYIPRITSQLCITAETPKALAILSWNSSWDVLLLSAIFHTEIGFNLQSDVSSEEISATSTLRATNLHLHGINDHAPYVIVNEDIGWISRHFDEARQLLEHDNFQTAVHCLASYRWHSMPRVKMAVIWAGIEGLFQASVEIRFSISIYIARFLYPDNAEERQKTFNQVKDLYNIRSASVHGAKTKKNSAYAVEESAALLRALLLRSVELRSLPIKSELVP
jgi:hypothetical protein